MIGWLVGWKVKALLAAGIVLALTASHGWAYWQGRSDGATATEALWLEKEAARETAATEATNELFRRQALRDAQRAKEAADLRQKVKDHEDYIAGMADGECLVGPDADRLRDLWR